MAVKGNHKRVVTRTYDGPCKLQIQSTGSILAFKEFHPHADRPDQVIFEYTYTPPTKIRGKLYKDFAGVVGRTLRLTPPQIETMLRKEHAKAL